MAIAVGNTASVIQASYTNTGTIAGFAIEARMHRILVVHASIGRAGPAVTSITHNGRSLSWLGTVTNGSDIRLETWYLLNPDVGTYDISITLAGSSEFVAGGTVFYGVHPTSPFGTIASATGSSTTPSVAVTSGANELVIDIMGARGTSSDGVPTATVGANQTALWNVAAEPSVKSTRVRGAGSYEAGAASVTMSWTLSFSAIWAIGGVPLKPAPITTLQASTL
jgi:hypothetical protein